MLQLRHSMIVGVLEHVPRLLKIGAGHMVSGREWMRAREEQGLLPQHEVPGADRRAAGLLLKPSVRGQLKSAALLDLLSTIFVPPRPFEIENNGPAVCILKNEIEVTAKILSRRQAHDDLFLAPPDGQAGIGNHLDQLAD